MNWSSGIQIIAIIILSVLLQTDYTNRKALMDEQLHTLRVHKSYRQVANLEAVYGENPLSKINEKSEAIKQTKVELWDTLLYRMLFVLGLSIVTIYHMARYSSSVETNEGEYSIQYLRYHTIGWLLNFIYLFITAACLWLIIGHWGATILFYVLSILTLMMALLDIGKTMVMSNPSLRFYKPITRILSVLLYYHLIGVIVLGYLTIYGMASGLIKQVINYLATSMN
jgi:hypothetical protein